MRDDLFLLDLTDRLTIYCHICLQNNEKRQSQSWESYLKNISIFRHFF